MSLMEIVQIFKYVAEIAAILGGIVLGFMKSGVIYEYFVSRYGAAKKILMDREIQRSEALKQVAQEVVELAEFKKLTGVDLYNSVCIPAIVDLKNRLGKDFTIKQAALANQFLVFDENNKVIDIKEPGIGDHLERFISSIFSYSLLTLFLLSALMTFLISDKYSMRFFVVLGATIIIFLIMYFTMDLYVIFTAPIPISRRIKKQLKLIKK